MRLSACISLLWLLCTYIPSLLTLFYRHEAECMYITSLVTLYTYYILYRHEAECMYITFLVTLLYRHAEAESMYIRSLELDPYHVNTVGVTVCVRV